MVVINPITGLSQQAQNAINNTDTSKGHLTLLAIQATALQQIAAHLDDIVDALNAKNQRP